MYRICIDMKCIQYIFVQANLAKEVGLSMETPNGESFPPVCSSSLSGGLGEERTEEASDEEEEESEEMMAAPRSEWRFRGR